MRTGAHSIILSLPLAVLFALCGCATVPYGVGTPVTGPGYHPDEDPLRPFFKLAPDGTDLRIRQGIEKLGNAPGSKQETIAQALAREVAILGRSIAKAFGHTDEDEQRQEAKDWLDHILRWESAARLSDEVKMHLRLSVRDCFRPPTKLSVELALLELKRRDTDKNANISTTNSPAPGAAPDQVAGIRAVQRFMTFIDKKLRARNPKFEETWDGFNADITILVRDLEAARDALIWRAGSILKALDHLESGIPGSTERIAILRGMLRMRASALAYEVSTYAPLYRLAPYRMLSSNEKGLGMRSAESE